MKRKVSDPVTVLRFSQALVDFTARLGSNPTQNALEIDSMDLNHAGTSVALSPTTDEMRENCSALVREMLSWPHVSVSHVFGVCALYHRKTMFAMLPDKRTLQSSTAITFRVAASETSGEDVNWQLFEINHRDQMTTALASLERAYRGSSRCGASHQQDAVTH